jgi:hypothetical protein
MRLFCHVALAPIVLLAQAPAPAISFEKTHHDFGRMQDDQKATHRYKVANKGSAILEITEIIPSCGCTFSVAGQRSLKPGEETFIEAVFDPLGMTGNIQKTLTVRSNDPKNGEIVLTFEASVMREIMPSSMYAIFSGLTRTGPAISKTIRLESGDGQPIIVTDAKIPGAPYLVCNPQKDGNDVILNISLDGKLLPPKSSQGTDNLAVRTTSKKAPVLHFQIHWDVQPTILAAPEWVTWLGEKAGKELRAAIALRHPQGKHFKILDAKASSSVIRAAGITKGSAAEHKFEIVMSAKAKAGAYREILTLKLDDPEQQSMEIPIVAVLQ